MIEVLLIDIKGLDEHQVSEGLSRKRHQKSSRYVHLRDRLRSYAAGQLMENFIPHEGELCFTEYGKPYYSGGPEFSVSHGGSYAVLAVTDSEAPVGIDIECAQRNIASLKHLRRAVSSDEWDVIDGDCCRFMEIWTRREAVFKCMAGIGDIRELPSTIIGGDEMEVSGSRFFIQTIMFDGHFISVASRGRREEISGSIIKFETGERIRVF